jgi:hypothetical protein
MDFSHIVNFPDVTEQGRGTGTIEAVRTSLAKLDQDYTTEVFDQSVKLRNLHKSGTQQMVYVILDAVSVSTPEALMKSHRHLRPLGDISMEEFNDIAGDIPITIVSTIPNCEEVYTKTCAKYNVQSNIKNFVPIDKFGLKYVLHFNLETTLRLSPIPDDPDINCEYLFCITNGRTKMPRLFLMEELWNRKLLDKALWSWQRNEESAHVDPATHINPNFNFPYKQHKPIDEHIWHRDIAFANHITAPPITGYNNCYIDIMVESIDEPWAIFCTEKTIRPYMYLKPSLQLNNYGHYRYLKSLGIELYDELFDYDIVERPSLKERINGIADNLTNLSKYSKYDMDQKVLKLKDKMLYNRQLLLDMKMETMPNAEIEYLLSHNIIPNDLNSPYRVSTIGTKWINS